MSRLRRGLLIAAATTAVGVLGAELFLMLLHPVDYLSLEFPEGKLFPALHRTSSIDGLLYELAPSTESELLGIRVRVNSLGMRDAEPLPCDRPGLFRIAVLGDSIGFGWRVEASDGFADRLEERLAASDSQSERVWEVLNFSVTGYSAQDEAALLEGRVLDFEPDLLVIAYCFNDPEASPRQPLSLHFSERPLWHRFQLGRLIAKRSHLARVEELGGGDYYRYLHAPGGAKWPTVVDAFERIRAATEPRGIPVLVVVFPWPRVESWAEYPYEDLHLQVAGLAQGLGFGVVDLLESFRGHAPHDVVFSRRDPHPRALGHDLAAAAVEAWILAREGR